jgi:hypothetical protein
MKFIALIFRLLPNEAHYRFFERVIRELGQAGSALLTALGTLVAELNDWYVKEAACMAWVRKNTLTAKIAAADQRVDNALVGMLAQVKAMRHNVNLEIAGAAEHLHNMLKSYGKVISKPYLQEVGAVNAILKHLNGDYAAEALITFLVPWKEELEAALLEFTTLFEQREAQTLEKPKETFPEVRRGIDNVWRQIVTRVNSGAELGASPDFEAFIKLLNPEIEYLNKEFHRVKYDISTAEPAPIDPQPYTGKACTPVPEVIFKKGDEMLQLILGKDFNVTYKNNVNVGNADCIIHGKGAYKGTRTVTFIIKHF